MNEVTCPRCGYDQQGTLEAWRSAVAAEGEGASCPLHGVCSECGLRFGWGSLLNPKLRAASWLFEHVRGAGRVVRTSLRNGLSELDGRAWWRLVRLEHAVKPLRLAVHWLVWVVLLQLVFGAFAAGYLAWKEYSVWQLYYANPAPGGVAQPWTQRQTDELLRVTGRVFVWPWGGGQGWLSGWGWGRGWFEPVDFVVVLVIASAVTSLSFMLLPATMARVRVRRVHLLRGFGHSAPLVAVLTLLWALGCWAMDRVLEWEANRTGWRVDIGEAGVPDRVVVLSLVIWLFWGLWWWRYVREYLRLPRAGWVAFALVLIGLMAAVVLARPVEGAIEWVLDAVGRLVDQLRGIVKA